MRTSNVTNTSVVISWETVETTSGAVRYAVSGTLAFTAGLAPTGFGLTLEYALTPGPSPTGRGVGAASGPSPRGRGVGVRAVPLAEAPGGDVAADARGVDFVGDTHYVVLTGLSPSTSYQYLIEVGGQLVDDGGAPFAFQTGPTVLSGAPNSLVGRLLDEAGEPAGGCPLFVQLTDGNGAASSGSSTWLSALTESDGTWLVELQARTADLLASFDYQIPGDTIVVESLCGARGSATQTYPTSVVDPAQALGDSGTSRWRRRSPRQSPW